MEYFVIGADGNRYGPYDIKKLEELAMAGRINHNTTLIDTESGAGVMAGYIINFNEVSIPPSVNEGYDGTAYKARTEASQKTNTLIILSFVFLVLPLQLIGAITSAFALKSAKKEGSNTTLPVIALILNLIVVLIIIPITCAIMFPVFAQARVKSQQTQCLSNMKQINTAMIMYASDYDGFLPNSKNWQKTLEPYVRNEKLLTCPEKGKNHSSYAMNDAYSGANIDEIKDPSEEILIFEALPNVTHGTMKDIKIKRDGPTNIGYCDGHVSIIRSLPGKNGLPSGVPNNYNMDGTNNPQPDMPDTPGKHNHEHSPADTQKNPYED